MYPDNDKEFRDYTVESAKLSAGWWDVRTTESTCFGIEDNLSPVKPKSGDAVRLYMSGWSFIRGIFINGQQVFYRTTADQDTINKAEAIKQEEVDRAKFEMVRAEHDRRIAALPEPFRQRIAKFQYNNPDFRWKFEGYELFCCEQAVVIADAMKTPEAIRDFHKMDWAEQVKNCPGLSDGHSGNTFGCAVTLAHDYLTEKSNIVKRHGALAPLVGSEEYGCVPR